MKITDEIGWKMSLFDKINEIVIVEAFKQVSQWRHSEVVPSSHVQVGNIPWVHVYASCLVKVTTENCKLLK